GRLPRREGREDTAGLPALRGPARAAAVADPRGRRRGAARRCRAARGARAEGGRRSHPRRLGGDDSRLALVLPDAGRGPGGNRPDRRVRPRSPIDLTDVLAHFPPGATPRTEQARLLRGLADAVAEAWEDEAA